MHPLLLRSHHLGILVARNEAAQACQILHELVLRDARIRVSGHAHHHLLQHLVAGLGLAAPSEERLELTVLETAVPTHVHEVPLVLEGALQTQRVVHACHCPCPAQSAAHDHGVVFLIDPPLEQLRRLEAVWLPLVLAQLATEDIHKPVRWVLVRGHGEAQRFEVRLGPCGWAEVHCLAALAEQQHIVEEREEREARLVDDHDARHAELAHLLQRGDHRE
mmetsp:Transcript_30744/g.78349  ORF Transcript_30744/g.78349 Transcript_30744/m.78349 type:complete len:220 (+) Transcript_30744:1118-1777(+)